MRLIVFLVFLIPALSCRSLESQNSQTQSKGSFHIVCNQKAAFPLNDLNGEEVFDLTSQCLFDRRIHSIKIRVLSETFFKVLDDGCAGRDTGYGHLIEMKLDDVTIHNVGIRVRGNTSRCNAKRQFKFSFDAKKMYSVFNANVETKKFPENDDRKVFGLSGISVRASANDPTMVREHISSRTFTAAEEIKRTNLRGGQVYRAAFVKLFVSFNRTADEGPEGTFSWLMDGFYYDYKGLYSLAEHTDKVFLATRYQNGDEKLPKFYLYQADQAMARFTKSDYKREGWGQELVDGKSADHSNLQKGEDKLFELFDALNGNLSEKDLAAKIDIDNIVNYTASAILTGHWDSLIANLNNDSLLFNSAIGKWQLIAWDLDNSLGAQYQQYLDKMSDDIFKPAKTTEAKLFSEVFAAKNPSFRAKLKDRLKAMTSGFYSENLFDTVVSDLENDMKNTLEPWEGFQHQDFEDLKSFAKARRDQIEPQLN